MQVATFEGVIENGRIRLQANINLPENMRVFVIIPDFEAKKVAHVYSPHLVHPEQAADFKKEIVEGLSHAGV